MAWVTGSSTAWPRFREWQAEKKFDYAPPESGAIAHFRKWYAADPTIVDEWSATPK